MSIEIPDVIAFISPDVKEAPNPRIDSILTDLFDTERNKSEVKDFRAQCNISRRRYMKRASLSKDDLRDETSADVLWHFRQMVEQFLHAPTENGYNNGYYYWGEDSHLVSKVSYPQHKELYVRVIHSYWHANQKASSTALSPYSMLSMLAEKRGIKSRSPSMMDL